MKKLLIILLCVLVSGVVAQELKDIERKVKNLEVEINAQLQNIVLLKTDKDNGVNKAKKDLDMALGFVRWLSKNTHSLNKDNEWEFNTKIMLSTKLLHYAKQEIAKAKKTKVSTPDKTSVIVHKGKIYVAFGVVEKVVKFDGKVYALIECYKGKGKEVPSVITPAGPLKLVEVTEVK